MPQVRPSSEEEVANLALGKCKEDEIATFDDDLHRARVARRHFGLARDALLAELDWNFASAWQAWAAADVNDSPGPLKNRFVLATDTIVVRQVFAGSTITIEAELGVEEWQIETGRVTVAAAEVEAKILVCNQDTITVRYTRRVEAPRLWDALFVDAYVCKLAAAMAPELGRSRSDAAGFLTEAEEILTPKAKRVDSRERSPQKVGGGKLTSWLAARGGFRTRGW